MKIKQQKSFGLRHFYLQSNGVYGS